MSAARLLSLALMVSLTMPVAAFSQPAIPTGDVWPAPSDQSGAYAVVAPLQGGLCQVAMSSRVAMCG